MAEKSNGKKPTATARRTVQVAPVVEDNAELNRLINERIDQLIKDRIPVQAPAVEVTPVIDKDVKKAAALAVVLATKKAKLTTSKVNTLVIDTRLGVGLEYVESPAGHIWHYDGKNVYYMYRKYAGAQDTTGELLPVLPPETIEVTPESLYYATHWSRETKPIFFIETSLMDKINTGLMVVLAAILLLFIYIVISSL